jgi:hypothetical protein
MNLRVMPATSLATIKKLGFALLCCALLTLFAAPAWAQCSGEEPPPNCVANGTFTLEPGVQIVLPVGNNEYRFEPLNNLGGEQLTITAFSELRSDFDSVDPPETCVPVKDLTAAAGAQTCLEFQHDCSQGTASSNDCATFLYKVKWIYDLPPEVPALGGPDWKIIHGVDCPKTASDFATAQSIFVAYSVKKFDPVHSGGGGGSSCNAPEWTPGAPLITTATGFVGFDPPVSTTDLNTIKAGRTVPLKWLQLDRFGIPVTNLTLCTDTSGLTCTPPWVMIQSTPIVCPGSNAIVTAGLTPLTGTFNNQRKGRYHFNWNTDPSSMGCVAVVLTFDTGVVASPANFSFK